MGLEGRSFLSDLSDGERRMLILSLVVFAKASDIIIIAHAHILNKPLTFSP